MLLFSEFYRFAPRLFFFGKKFTGPPRSCITPRLRVAGRLIHMEPTTYFLNTFTPPTEGIGSAIAVGLENMSSHRAWPDHLCRLCLAVQSQRDARAIAQPDFGARADSRGSVCILHDNLMRSVNLSEFHVIAHLC